jgi:ketosteroid isomerase-like protein
MITRRFLLSGTAAIAFAASASIAAAEDQTEKVKAASQAFYAALDARDPSAMAKVYAHTPYVVHIDPTAKVIALGWEAVNKSWENVHDGTTQINVLFTETGQPQIVGDLAWEVGHENGPVTTKDGKIVNIDAFATNVYQNINGEWRLVSHQAGQIQK